MSHVVQHHITQVVVNHEHVERRLDEVRVFVEAQVEEHEVEFFHVAVQRQIEPGLQLVEALDEELVGLLRRALLILPKIPLLPLVQQQRHGEVAGAVGDFPEHVDGFEHGLHLQDAGRCVSLRELPVAHVHGFVELLDLADETGRFEHLANFQHAHNTSCPRNGSGVKPERIQKAPRHENGAQNVQNDDPEICRTVAVTKERGRVWLLEVTVPRGGGVHGSSNWALRVREAVHSNNELNCEESRHGELEALHRGVWFLRRIRNSKRKDDADHRHNNDEGDEGDVIEDIENSDLLRMAVDGVRHRWNRGGQDVIFGGFIRKDRGTLLRRHTLPA